MQKIISLSISLFCFTPFLQSCEDEIIAVKCAIYTETLTSPSGVVVSDGVKRCMSLENAKRFPLFFKKTFKDNSSATLKFWGVQHSNNENREVLSPFKPACFRVEIFPENVKTQNIVFIATNPIELSAGAHIPLTSLKETRFS